MLYRFARRAQRATPIKPVARSKPAEGSGTPLKPPLPKSVRPLPKSPPPLQSLEMVFVSIVTAAIERDGPSAQNPRTGIQRDALVREDIARERRQGTEGCGTADGEIDASVATTIDDVHGRAAGGRQGAPDLEHEQRIGITSTSSVRIPVS